MNQRPQIAAAETSPPPLPVEDHGTNAHSKFGGSVAARILNCPASVKLIEAVPAHLRRLSADAIRGTALHVAMPRLIERECSLDDLVGETIGGYAITRDDVENFLRPVLAWVDALLDRPGDFTERRVVFPTVPGAFGTADLIVRIGSTIYVIDFKFGRGVRVLAFYPDGDEDVINAQPLFYTAGVRHSLPEFCAGVDTFVLTILQPQSIEPDAEMVSSVTITHDEPDEFVTAYRAACEESLSESPHLERGAWCRFCPAKPICPEHTKPLLDLAQFAELTSTLSDDVLATASKEAYLQLLADGLNFFEAVKDLRTTLRDQTRLALAQGDVVPGYALSAGRAERHWRDDEGTAIAALKRLGLRHDDIIVEAMRSPKQVELRAKARGVKVPKELISSKPSGVSLVKAENAHAPILGRGELAREFSEALQAFRRKEPMTDRKHDHDYRNDLDPDANDNHTSSRGQNVAAAMGSTALASLSALQATLNAVDTASVAGWSGLPMLQFKSREGGIWLFGLKKTVVEDNSKWAINPASFKWGYVCFNDNNKPTERLVPVSQPKPDVTTLPDTGFEWHEQWTVGLKCITGADAGVEAIYKAATIGGIQAIAGAIDATRDRLNGGQHDGKVSPIVLLERDSYPHSQYGKIWTPTLRIVDWMPLSGPAPAPASPPPPTSSPSPAAASEQPRRRRVA